MKFKYTDQYNIKYTFEIIDNKIQWTENDYTNCSVTLNGQMPIIGDDMLDKIMKLKAFL